MIEGVTGIHHIGLSVPNIEAATEFYCGILGMEATPRYDFPSSARGDAVLALQGASAKSLLLRAGNTYLELFEFTSPAPRPQDGDRPVCDHGFTHLAFDVKADAIHALHRRLEAAGVRWHAPLATDGDGFMNTYGRDPFGNVIEIQAVDPEGEFGVGRLPRWNP